MSSDVILYCERLKLSVGASNTKQASISLDAIDQYFNDRISDDEIDLAIDKVLNDDGGVLGFLKLCTGKYKTFKDETVKSFDLIIKITELYKKKVTPYASTVVIICLQYIRSMQTSAREKEKAGAVIETLVIENCCDSVDRSYLMRELIAIVDSLKAGTAQSRIIGLIGRLAKDYPDCIENNSADAGTILDMFFKVLEGAAINKHDTSLVSLTGALSGLNDFLEHFGPSENTQDAFAERLYKCIKMMTMPVEAAQKTYSVQRSALNLLACRCNLFNKQVFEDFFYWHDLLEKKWLTMTQFENRRPAIYLMHAIHREIAVVLMNNDDSDRCRQILTFLQNYFKKILESSNSQAFEVRLAFVGFGLMAAPCKRILSADHLNELFRLVMQRTESAANSLSHNSKEQLEHFPDYVEALSRIMEQIDQLSGIQLNVLQNIIVSVIRNFHLLSTAHHDMTINTLMRTFHNLSQLGDSVVDDILERVVNQGIIWTCSHKLPFDAKNDWNADIDWKDQVTYTSYLPLWKGFLAEFDNCSYNRNAIAAKIYDQMMRTLFRILDKLNLNVKKRKYCDHQGEDQELFFSDPNFDLEPVRVKDFHIFFNLVSFYQDILKAQTLTSHKEHFLKWVNQFIEEVISKSLKYPLVSGFVKLLQVVLSITNRLNYFGNDLYEDSATQYDAVYFYLRTNIRKAQQSSGELKIACLKLLFTTPTCMLCCLITDMIPVFRMAFEIGKSNASLFIAEMGLNAIERYLTSVGGQTSNEVKEFLQAVLPYFDAYLQGFKSDPIRCVEMTPRNRLPRTKRTAQKLIKIKENDLMKFQKRIILLLGTLEPEYCQYLLRYSENVNLVKWNISQKTIELTLFGQNFHPIIHMDSLIPRICEIATTTTDRQKKMTACEIIQATIIYLIGSSRHRGKLWSELCKLMLEMGCDGDVGVQQMFEPLVMQTMHYMSRNDQLNQEGTTVLLECLMNAISHPNDLAIRDLAARSLREFLSWSIRQANPDQLRASPFNIVTLIKQLKMYSSDMQYERRFGAALAFNNIYRILREEETIIDKYWLDLLHDFAMNFKMSEQQMEQHSNSQTDLNQISSSLDHILRVLQKCKAVFNTKNPDRIKPSVLNESLLHDAVLWILSQCRSQQESYRKKMMDIFITLAPCVDGFNGASAFIRETQTTTSVIDLCENGIEIKTFDPNQFNTAYVWLKQLHTTLDCYIWFIENNFMLTWQSVFSNRSKIFAVLQHYIANIMNRKVLENDDGNTGSIIEKDKLNAEKSTILLLIFTFLNKTMSIGCVPDAVWLEPELILVIETGVFQPHHLECDIKNPEFLSKLPKSLEMFISNINRHAPKQFKTDLNRRLVTNTMGIYQNLTDSVDEVLNRNSISTGDTNNLKGIDLICSLIRSKNVLIDGNFKENVDIMASKMLYQIFDGIQERQGDVLLAKFPSPDTLKFSNHLLDVCLNQKSGIHVNVIDLIMNSTELKLYDSMKSIRHGKHFLTLFKMTIYQFFLKNVELIVERLVSKMLPLHIPYVLRILIEVTEYAYKSGAHNIIQMKSLTNILLSTWPEILSKVNQADQMNVATTVTLAELIGQLAMICPYDLTEISKKAPDMEDWILNLIKSNDKLIIETKTQAIFLLPCLIGPSNYDHDGVQQALEHFQKLHFPLFTEELRPGSVERTTFENTFQIVLDTMCASKSPVILKFVINCTAPDKNHIMDHKIIKSLRKFMGALSVVPEHQLYCLNTVFEMFLNQSLDSAIRLTLMDRFLCHMILGSTKDTVIKFYASHIVKIEQLIDTPYGLEMSEFRLEQAFTSRTGGFQLVETLVAILTRTEICDAKNPIVIAKFGDKIKKGNELLVWMSRKTTTTKSESFQTTNAKHMEWFRKYQCAVFKTLCAIISNTATDLKFFDLFVFVEKNWTSMIDTTDSTLYKNRSLEVDKKPLIKERLVSIRRRHEDNANQQLLPSRKYIETQNVFESSLSQDVTKIDLSNSYVRTADEVEHQNRLANYQPKTLMLEKNSINDHEVMATVCATIEHMFENKITPINEDGTVRRQKILWVENLCNVIANKNNKSHINVRVFLATAVDNCHEWLSNYADVLTPAILKFVVDWINFSESIDATAIFLIVDLLEWDSMYKITKDSDIEEQNLASTLVEILMKHCFHQKKEFFRRNVELIRNLLERWHDFIQIPHQFLLEKISDPSFESKSNISGIHLNGAVLKNELLPWTDESKLDFLKAIGNCLQNKYTDVYQPAAQVCGMALEKMMGKENNGENNRQNNEQTVDGIEEFMNKLVSRLKAWIKSDEKRFMHVLFYLDKYYVINGFVSTITGLIAKSTSDVKRFYLQMFLSRVNEADAEDIKIILNDLMNQSKEHQHQLLGLHIFNKSLSKLSIQQIKDILPRITLLQDAKQSEIRDVIYVIMIYIRENYGMDTELHRKATEILLNGLNDIDKKLQSTVYNYWSEVPELKNTTLNDRVLYMLRNLYNQDFMKYGPQLLIDLRSPDFKNNLRLYRFDDHDDETKYVEYDINVDWKSQNSSLRVPLFTESQQKQIINGEIDLSQGYLRATQRTLRFDPTLEPSSVHPTLSSFTLHSQNSLLFGTNSQELDRRSQVKWRTQDENSQSNQQSNTRFNHLRSRILRNQNQASREKALSAVRRRNYKNEQEMQQHQQKSGQVTLYRRYRFGDYPDFFINSLAFLLPLQMLVQLDPILARNTFVAILNAIYRALDGPSNRNAFLIELTQAVENILKDPNQCDPMLYSALTEVSLTNDAVLNIDPKVTTTAIPNENANDVLINTILLLEKQLNSSTRLDSAKTEQIWAELANMYYTLSEYDVCASIFSDKIECDELLSRAIELESNGDYRNALKSYMDLVNKEDDIASNHLLNKYANDFSYQSLFNCYEVLGQWEDLESNVIEQLTDENGVTVNYEHLWTDEWNKKYLLPHYMRSELRTLLYTPTTVSTAKYLENVQQWLRNNERSDFIKKNYSEQLMILSITNKDYLHAKVYSNQYFEGFLSDWSAMSMLTEKMRNNKLMNTRRVAEIHKYAELLSAEETIDDVVIEELINRWRQTHMSKADSLQMWEALVSYRIFISEHSLTKFNQRNTRVVNRLVECMFGMQFELNQMAIEQQNIGLAETVMGRLNSFRQIYGENTKRNVVQYELSDIQHKHIECYESQKKMSQVDYERQLGQFLDIWTQLHAFRNKNDAMLNADPDIKIKMLHQLHEVFVHSNDVLSQCDPENISSFAQEKISELTGCMDESQDIFQQMNSYSRQSCRESIAILEKCQQNRSQSQFGSSKGADDIGESFYRLALFCLKQLKATKSDEHQLEMEELLIVSVLRGMQFGSKNARIQFPRLLQLANINTEKLTSVFNQELNQVELWMFLGWVPQILSRYDFEKPCYLDNLLLRLSTSYPSAVTYSFDMTFDLFRGKNSGAQWMRENVKQIKNALISPMMENFIKGLNCLTLPNKVLEHHLRNMHRAKTEFEFKDEVKACMAKVFNNDMRGKSIKNVEKIKNDFLKLQQLDYTNEYRQIKKLTEQMIEAIVKVKSSDKTGDYCPWLVNYQWYGGDDFIELPGQYTGNAKPNPTRILKIVKFNDTVTVLHSLRKPIRVSVTCSDGKLYHFIVKYGEDLRRDAHIQLIQNLMSDQMKRDKNCNQQKLSLRTYNVTPLNMSCGIIEWVDNTESVQPFIYRNIPNVEIFNNKKRKQYEAFLLEAEKEQKHAGPANISAALHYPLNVIADNLKEVMKDVPKNAFLNGLYQLSSTPECFFALRNNFAKSLATMCIVHWLLGIGDRHLGNFLIDTLNGQLIGIDFNMAFGAATRDLPIPELIPFRLTDQFVNMLKPLGTSGFLAKCMAHVLRTFRVDSESLLSVCEVIIYERDANRDSHQSSALSNSTLDSNDGGTTINPEKHISTIKKKLSGFNPMELIENDLRSGYFANEINVLAAYLKILRGLPTGFRFKLKSRGLSADEQVKCLIDIARDPSVLGVSFYGYQPWL